MIKVGIACHKLANPSENENQAAGIGRHLYKFLEEISKRQELQKEFRFYLYFDNRIPDIHFLNGPIFIKKVAKLPFFFPLFRPSYNIFFHITLPFYTLKDKVDITFFPSFMLPAFFLGKSAAVLTNDVYYEYTKGTLPFKYKISYMLFSNWAAKRATRIITYTNTAKNEIVKYFKVKPEKIDVIPLGVDADYISSYANGIKKENLILYVGQAFPRRHLKEKIIAFKKVAPEFPNLKFHAVGTDNYNPPIISQLVEKTNQELGSQQIIYENSVSDQKLMDLLHKAKLILYVSSSEAMGLPPIEALAANTPAVVAENDLTKEIFGNNAFFVNNPENTDSIAQTISTTLKDTEKQKEIVDNREEVLSKYTWKKNVDLTLNLFRKIVNK